MGPENSERVQNHFRRGTRLSDYIPGHPALLANLESKGFSLVEDLFNWEAGGWVLRPWIEVKRSHHEQPCAWYTALQSIAQHIVAEEFRDSRLEPHEYGRLGPEDEEPFSDSDASDSEDSPQSAPGSPPLTGGRSAALIPDAASLPPSACSSGTACGGLPSPGLEYGQDPLLSTDEELWELLDSSSARVDVAPPADASSDSYTLASLSPGPSSVDGSAAAIARRLLEARRILAAKAGAARPPSPDIEVENAFEELTFAHTDGVAGPPRPFAPWMDSTDIPPGAGPEDSYFFATDGSVDRAARRGGYSSVTPHSVEGWEKTGDDHFYSREQGVSCYGSEPVAVDTCELLAVVDVLEHGPRANLTLLVDASYIMFGFHSHESGLRRLIRGTNRALWLRARAALTSRNKDGFFVRFRKCSSHGKDSKQHQLISLWNNRADTKAKLGCKTRQGDMHEWVPDGDFSFRLLYRGKLVRGDPRKHIGKAFQWKYFEHAATLKDAGVLPALVQECPGGISIGTLQRNRSAVQLSRGGQLPLLSFAFSLQGLSLPTPSRFYLSKGEVDKTKLTAHLPRERGKCICPLCGYSKPDTWHYHTEGAAGCSFTSHLRAETQGAVGSLFAGICSLKEYDSSLPQRLVEWFEEFFEDVVGMETVDICNATPGSGRPEDALDWKGLHAWPFLLCTPKTLHEFLKVPGRPTSSLLLVFPAGRFPKGTTSVKKQKNGKTVKQKFTAYETDDICLVLLRNARQLPVPTKEALEELVEVIAPNVLMGTWGLTLAWGTERFPLDNVRTDLADRLLLETGFLRSAPTLPPRVWHHSHTWLGHLPKVIEGRVGQSLSLLSPKARQHAKDTISRTILAGQLKTWEATQAMITRYLKRQKIIQRATDLQKPAPVFRRLYASLGPGKALFPPSRRHLEKARLYLRAGYPLGRDNFMQHARQLALGSAELPSVWLAVLLESVNRDAKELAKFRGVDESTPSLDIASPVEYSGAPYISPGNLERLSQAESRTRLAIRQQAQQPEAQEVLGREGRLSLGKLLMMRKFERERREHEARRAALHPSGSGVPPEPSGSASAPSEGTAILPPTPVSSVETNLDLSEEGDEAAEEIIHDLSDEEDEAVELLSTFAPPQQEWPAERGSLLRPLSQAETVAAAAIQADPDKFGRATEASSLFGREHYSGAVMDNLVPKLTEWAKGLTRSDSWAFIPPDVLNGLMSGDSNNRAHQRVRRWTSESTQFACFLCGNFSHWFLVVADLGHCTMNIFNSAGTLGNQLAIKHLLPLLMYMGSFEDSIFGSSWGVEERHAVQQQNGYDCGPFTIANCLRIVYSWGLRRVIPLPPMSDFRLRVATLVTSQVQDAFWQGLC